MEGRVTVMDSRIDEYASGLPVRRRTEVADVLLKAVPC